MPYCAGTVGLIDVTVVGKSECTELKPNQLPLGSGDKCGDFYQASQNGYKRCYKRKQACKLESEFIECNDSPSTPPTPPAAPPIDCFSLGNKIAIDSLRLSQTTCAPLAKKKFASYGGSACGDFYQTDGDGVHKLCYEGGSGKKPCKAESRTLVCEPPSAPPTEPPAEPPSAL